MPVFPCLHLHSLVDKAAPWNGTDLSCSASPFSFSAAYRKPHSSSTYLAWHALLALKHCPWRLGRTGGRLRRLWFCCCRRGRGGSAAAMPHLRCCLPLPGCCAATWQTLSLLRLSCLPANAVLLFFCACPSCCACLYICWMPLYLYRLCAAYMYRYCNTAARRLATS